MTKYLDTLTDSHVEAFLWTAGSDQAEAPEWFADMLRAGEIEFKDAGTPEVSLVSRGLRVKPGVYLLRHPKGGVVPVRRQRFEVEFEAIA